MNTETHFHVIKDPVHGTMQFSTEENKWLKPFIDSPHFQRLRHIKQLGMSDYIFPGAVHTRFNHSLGCSYIASQIAHKIGLTAEERQLVMLACLLHDIGHGPFSHTFEDLFRQKLIPHEAWTPFFLADYSTQRFFNEFNRNNPHCPLTQEKFLLIEDMIMHKSIIKPVLADIVSSQLDADRLDYLLRDSHFCGVTYGQYDFRWMLNSMVVVKGPHGERLGLTHKGTGAVEHYLMARRLMTRNIYFHQKKLGLEHFLIQLLAHLAKSLGDDAQFNAIKATRLGNFLMNVNQFNQQTHNLAAAKITRAKQSFLAENYALYKELGDHDVFLLIKSLAQMESPHTVSQIAQRLHDRAMPKIIRFDQVDLKKATAVLAQFKQDHASDLQDWQITLIKAPHQSYTEEGPILIIDENGIIRPLNEISLMINAISDRLEQTAFLCIDKPIFSGRPVQTLIKKLSEQ